MVLVQFLYWIYCMMYFFFFWQRLLCAVTIPYVTITTVNNYQNFFQHFYTEVLQIPFFFSFKNWRFWLLKTEDRCGSRLLTLICRMKHRENLQNSDKGPFFGDQSTYRQCDDLFFLFWDPIKPDIKDEKIFCIFTLSKNVHTISGIFARDENLEGTLIGKGFYS